MHAQRNSFRGYLLYRSQQAQAWLGAISSVTRQQPLITAIITTRNRGSYLKYTLESLRWQSLPANMWEIIVCDFGSDDDTREIIETLSDSCLPLRAIHGKDTSVDERESVYQNALTIARGQSIAFLSDDQVLTPNFLACHVKRQINGRRLVVGDVAGQLHTHIFAPLSPPLTGACPSAPALKTEEIANLNSLSSLMEMFAQEQRANPCIQFASILQNASAPTSILRECGGIDYTFFTREYISRDIVYRLSIRHIQIVYERGAQSLRQKTPWEYGHELNLQADRRHFISKHGDQALDAVFNLIDKNNVRSISIQD